MDSIIIKMFPAQNGDCFLISLGTINKYHILIDCGYTDTYKKYLRDALVEIAENKESINLFVISHIDQDHIQGAISFLQDNNENQLIEIDEIWHNSWILRGGRATQSPEIEPDDPLYGATAPKEGASA